MTDAITVELSLHTVNELNATSWHWRKRQKYRQGVRHVVGLALGSKRKPVLPVHVTIVRLSAGTLDTVGLYAALKTPQDAVAEWLGVDDRESDTRARWEFGQEKCKRGQYGLRMTIRSEGSKTR